MICLQKFKERALKVIALILLLLLTGRKKNKRTIRILIFTWHVHQFKLHPQIQANGNENYKNRL